ncbi:GDSL-like Lipase/Acylhydrolase [Pseudobutyrivibrio xylanivorans]|uniref:GDSL-like Lipase/Acylhydrolase n=2 Tax=Pseudobutyrivibrio xylanivorans TaxID=185007 RepID=A0A1G5RR34_PSEXY|nr:GDSL-like Lipase/Acylhydrolase [Pseudobutyrivibrio xylanivorans]
MVKKMKMSRRYLRCVAVGLLFTLCAVPSMNSKAEEITQPVETPVQEVPVQEAPVQPLTEEQQAELIMQEQLAQVTAEQSTRQLVIIGDSRTVGMKSAVGKNANIWSAKVGMGLAWMKNVGVPSVEDSINENTDVVILMGVNDVRSLSYTDKYVSYINEKAAAWTTLGANVYYVSVNPMAFETKSYPGITNSLIEKWNTKMQDGLSENVHYIDTYSTMLGNVSSKDGIHYSKNTYKTIYTLINQGIIIDKLEQKMANLC